MAGDGRLPPIEDIVPPEVAIKTTLIRWYRALGYEVKEISRYMGIRYQQVRNVTTNMPKRAAREDLPPLEIVLRDTPDIIQAALDGALDQSLLADRKGRKAEEKAQRRADREFRDDEEED
jgi:hypothetical protein